MTIFDQEPVYIYGDQRSLADGVLIDLLTRGVKVHFNSRPITRMTAALFDALNRYSGGGTEAEQASALQALLGFTIAGAYDTARDGEPTGELYRTPDHKALGDQVVYLYPNDDGWTVMFASDW